MELKHYDKSWLPAFKGVFLILFGIIAMLKIFGSIRSIGVLFLGLIVMISILLIATGIRDKKSESRWISLIFGIINLGFFLFLIINADESRNVFEVREGLFPVLVIWLLYYAVTEIIDAAILWYSKNAFFALFLINSILTLVFAHLLYMISGNLTEQSVTYIGIIALAVGLVNVLSTYLLSRIKA